MSRLCSPVVTDHTTFFNGQSAKRRVPVSLRVESSHPSASRIATYTRDACLAVLAPGRCLGRGREAHSTNSSTQAAWAVHDQTVFLVEDLHSGVSCARPFAAIGAFITP